MAKESVKGAGEVDTSGVYVTPAEVLFQDHHTTGLNAQSVILELA